MIGAVPASAGPRGEAPLLKGHSATKQLLWARSSNQRPSAELVAAAAAESAGKAAPVAAAAKAEPEKKAAAKPAARKTAAKAKTPAAKRSPLPEARPAAVAAAPAEKPAEVETAAAPAPADKALKEGRATTTSDLPGVTTTPAATTTTTAAVKTTAEEPTKTAAATPRGELQQMVARHAAAAGIPFSLAHGVVMVESRYRANATGPGGYIGLMQLSYRTAQGMGFKGSRKALYDPETNIRYGVKYLAGAYRKAGGSTCGAVSKYQGGHGVKGVTKAGAVYCSKVRRFIAQMPKDQKVQLASSEE